MRNIPINKLFRVENIAIEGDNVYLKLLALGEIFTKKYYKIPTKKFQELANITAGTIIINDSGTIKPFPITSKV